MIHHDLGQFVTNRQVLAWTLGLGFSMSYRASAPASLGSPGRASGCDGSTGCRSRWPRATSASRSADFRHDRGPRPAWRTTARSSLNTGRSDSWPTSSRGRAARPADDQLAAFGFLATAPGLVAANLKSLGGIDFGDEGISFVAEGDGRKGDVWVYAPAGQEVAVRLPARTPGRRQAHVRRRRVACETAVADGVHVFRCRSRPGQPRIQTPPADLSGKAPRDWPGVKPAIGVLDLGPGVGLRVDSDFADDWVRALGQSRLAREHGVADPPHHECSRSSRRRSRPGRRSTWRS